MAENDRNEDTRDSTLTTNTPENDNENIPPIFEYQGPTDDKTFEQELGKTTRVEVPSFRPIYEIRRNKFLDDRRIEALEAGANAFDKLQLFDTKVLSKRLTYDIYLEETRLLDKVLSEVRYAATPDDTMIFAVDSNLFSRLLKRLLVVRKRAQDSILLAGMAIPKTPVWGCDGDIGKFHCSNDFEILGVCFRAEVEDFLWKIHEGSEFSKGSTFDTSSNDVNPGHRMAEREFAAAGPSRIEVLRSQGLGRDGAFSVRDQPAASSASDGYSQIRQKQAASIYGGQDRKGKGLVRPSAPEIPKHTPVLSAIFEQVGNKFFKVHREER